MSITEAKYNRDGSITAGPIEGQTWTAITESTRFWQVVQDWEAESVNNVITPWSEPLPTSAEVNIERDRRVSAGFTFNGKVYDFDTKSKSNISGASLNAFMAIVAGAVAGDLRWHGGLSDFAWIAQDNTLTTMDAQTVVAFGQTAAAHETAHIFAARDLKEAVSIPTNYTDNIWWP